jgi:hypothetical protein
MHNMIRDDGGASLESLIKVGSECVESVVVWQSLAASVCPAMPAVEYG